MWSARSPRRGWIERKLVTTPAYMLAGKVSEAYSGISACVKEVLALVEQ